MGTAADPLHTLARLALDDAQHRRVHAVREGDVVAVEEHDDDGSVIRSWRGTVAVWNRALHQAAGLKAPSSPGFTPEPKTSDFSPIA